MALGPHLAINSSRKFAELSLALVSHDVERHAGGDKLPMWQRISGGGSGRYVFVIFEKIWEQFATFSMFGFS